MATLQAHDAPMDNLRKSTLDAGDNAVLDILLERRSGVDRRASTMPVWWYMAAVMTIFGAGVLVGTFF